MQPPAGKLKKSCGKITIFYDKSKKAAAYSLSHGFAVPAPSVRES